MTPSHITIVQLQAVASLIRALPCDPEYAAREVSLGVNEAATAALAELPGSHRETTVYPADPECGRHAPYVINSEHITVDGVSFRAQTNTRIATEEDVARLAGGATAVTFYPSRDPKAQGEAA